MADQNDLIGVAVSYDMAWQRRSGGHTSNTGHEAVSIMCTLVMMTPLRNPTYEKKSNMMLKTFTEKILDFDTSCKLCRICDNATQSGQKPKPHDCRKNHSGSSKSMEPAVAVDLFQRAPLSKIKYHVYTGDDDTTTQSHIRENV